MVVSGQGTFGGYEIVTGLCDSIDLSEGFVAEYKVAVEAVFSRFKALKPVQPYLCKKVIDVKSRPEPLFEYTSHMGRGFRLSCAFETNTLPYGGAGTGLAEG